MVTWTVSSKTKKWLPFWARGQVRPALGTHWQASFFSEWLKQRSTICPSGKRKCLWSPLLPWLPQGSENNVKERYCGKIVGPEGSWDGVFRTQQGCCNQELTEAVFACARFTEDPASQHSFLVEGGGSWSPTPNLGVTDIWWPLRKRGSRVCPVECQSVY